MNPEKIVQAQLEAYNNRDIDAFVSCFSKDIKVYNFGEQNPFIEGEARLREVYKNIFDQSPKLYSHIVNRMVFDNKVLDQEEVSGRAGGGDLLEIIAIYEVEDDLIVNVHFIRKKG